MSIQNLRLGVLATLVALALCLHVGNVFAEGGDESAAAEEKSGTLLDKVKGMVGMDDEDAAEESQKAASGAKEAASESVESASGAAEAATEEATEESESLSDKAKSMIKGE